MIGTKIKELRKIRGLTQKELAEKAGVATGTIQQYELNKRQPKSEILAKISLVLDVDMHYFFSGYTQKEQRKLATTDENILFEQYLYMRHCLEQINESIYAICYDGLPDAEYYISKTELKSLKENVDNYISFSVKNILEKQK